MRYAAPVGLILCLLGWLAFPVGAAAQQPAAAKAEAAALRLDLAQSIATALKNNAELKEARLKIGAAESFLDEANAALFPSIELGAFVAPSPEYRGDVLAPRDDRARLDTGNTGSIGLFSSADLSIVQPLFTFGKITNLRQAARQGLAAERARVEQTRDEVVLKVKEFYYGLLLARELNEVLLEIEDIVKDAQHDAQVLLERDRGAQTDVLRLQVAQVVINQQKEEINKSIELARSALGHQLGVKPGTGLEITETALRREEVELLNLEMYVEMALQHRPELRRLRAGIAAKDHLVKAEESDYWPRFFIAGGARGGHSTSVDRQTNPFVNDPFNFLESYVALGFKWDLGFLKNQAEVKRARSEYEQLLAKQDFATTGIPLEVKKRYLEAKEAAANIANFRNGVKLARGLLALESSNFTFGLKESRDLIDALVSFATTEKSFFESLYQYNLSIARLGQAVGRELSALKYE
ncbi:MAG: TolC family protein [Candidatus Tectomicrobia bacterium]|nr:TolC family protein [Candidatus Tectomicrobia bacterium]